MLTFHEISGVGLNFFQLLSIHFIHLPVNYCARSILIKNNHLFVYLFRLHNGMNLVFGIILIIYAEMDSKIPFRF